jgi:phosphatidate cytidylyltransferase
MTPPPPPGRPGPSDPGTEPLPRVGAQLADPSGAGPGSAAWAPDDTGVVPMKGRPAPPPGSGARPTEILESGSGGGTGSGPRPTEVLPAGASLAPDELTGLATTEQPVGRKPGRSGRDLGAAIGVSLALGAVILLSLLVWRPAFLLVLSASVVVATIELVRALRKGGFRPPLLPVLAGGLLMIGLAWSRGPTGLVAGFLLTVLAVLLWRLADGPAGYLRDAAAGVLVALYVPMLAGFAVLLLVPDDGAARVIAFIVTVVCSDVGGFAAGVLFGKHPMAPSISPKKSWEGMAGSVSACMLAGVLLIGLMLDGPWWGGLIFGAAVAVSATIGDLGESLIKRDLGIKDMGDLLPGHGGLMDRMDSLLPTAAVAYLLMAVLVPA